ncbi:class I SAM-dependent RNA methyltransferase [Candidatus Saccharibacteria bacterium]|nr:class I SAM-dependent RNA methyltransferase [Candidatus Saccharibacteria bacterium]
MVKIEKIIPGGQALGTLKSGKKIFFWNALPGEIVTDYQVTKKKSHFEEAIATKIDRPSPFRVEPLDDCYLSTSPWQILDYAEELKLKQALVVEIFREHSIDIKTPEIFTDSSDYYYRNKMEYSLYWNLTTSKIELAFRARGSHRKIPITKSSIERPEIFTAARNIIDDLNARHEEARKYQSLLLRCNQKGEISGGLYENHQPHPVFPNLTDTILGHEYSYSPNGFFQINLPVYEMALTEIKKHIVTDQVLDLYAGVGTIGLSVARDRHLTLVECDKSAYTELARNITQTAYFENVRDNGSGIASEPRDDGRERSGSRNKPLSNIFAKLAKSEEVTDYIAFNQTVILDPPRAGCDHKLVDKLNEIKPEKIIYLSCNPSTQARDIKLLLDNYQIEDIKTFNFFPHTPHIENLVILSRK